MLARLRWDNVDRDVHVATDCASDTTSSSRGSILVFVVVAVAVVVATGSVDRPWVLWEEVFDNPSSSSQLLSLPLCVVCRSSPGVAA